MNRLSHRHQELHEFAGAVQTAIRLQTFFRPQDGDSDTPSVQTAEARGAGEKPNPAGCDGRDGSSRLLQGPFPRRRRQASLRRYRSSPRRCVGEESLAASEHAACEGTSRTPSPPWATADRCPQEKEDFLPYRFRIHIPDTDIIVDQFPTDLLQLLRSHGIENPFETTVTLTAEPQAVFKVQAVTRMSHRIPGHGEAILAAQFSPATSSILATGSGDKTARIWDTETGTPKYTLGGHTGWVLCVAFSPDGKRLATGSMDKTVRLWDPHTGKLMGSGPLTGHAKWITSIAWEPYHLWRDGTPRLASASKDGTVRVWVANTGKTEHVLSGHKSSVSCVRWGGTGCIYTGSHDKMVRVWNAEKGTLMHTLSSHAHWINHLALSTDFALRTAFFDHEPIPSTEEGKRAKAKARFEKAAKIQGKVSERLVSASDDFTMYLWEPSQGTKPVARMVGHQKQINHVTFSPDSTLIASAGWDNHTKLWSARDGKFINTLRGHVATVYQCAFSADSRLLVTASKDTTLKVWSMATHKLAVDLPGHSDEAWAVDWAPDGKRVGSGGKDKAVRLWQN
ncbi:putative WD40-repeat protein [Drechmeria coniospora]|uniref:Ribosome assembly protein 4 n=1 Tax=Drechmeria coniospora TaxID=98403 RepID=A0A151GGC5_DRECN|nr:putative WD40-repeat protein [Drechmeria coniospora]KYK56081.1 putative WD40-repeat protein [Drechmeria coniospora]